MIETVFPLISKWWWTLFLIIPAFFLLVPVSFQLRSHPWHLYVQWWGLTISYNTVDESPLSIRLFGIKLPLKKKKPKQEKKKKKKAPKAKTEKKPEKPQKHWKEYLALVEHPAVASLVKTLLRLFKGILYSFKIARLNWHISIDDFYQQGILCGLLHSVPESKKMMISGNFAGYNRFFLKIRFSIGRFFFTLFLFLVRFPYKRTWRLYKELF